MGGGERGDTWDIQIHHILIHLVSPSVVFIDSYLEMASMRGDNKAVTLKSARYVPGMALSHWHKLGHKEPSWHCLSKSPFHRLGMQSWGREMRFQRQWHAYPGFGEAWVYISFKGGGVSYCEYKIWFNALEGVGIRKESRGRSFHGNQLVSAWRTPLSYRDKGIWGTEMWIVKRKSLIFRKAWL